MTEENDVIRDELEESSDHEDHDSAWTWSGSNSWIWGIVLVGAGVLLMLRNFTGFELINLNNWWAVFILVPGISMLVNAFNASRRGAPVGGQAFWGGFLVLLALSFFFAIDFSLVWPVFLILAGMGLLLRAF